jgi:preprotein translocase subunit SecF
MSEETLHEMIEGKEKSFAKWYNKNYKLLLIIPLILLILSIGYIGYFYQQNNDFILKDVSLTGGISLTIFPEQEINLNQLKTHLSQTYDDFAIRELSDFRSGKQKAVVIESPLEPEEADSLKSVIVEFLGYELTNENSSTESTGSTLSQSFYKQLIYAIIISFSFMALVVLFIFGSGKRFKTILITITLIPVVLFFTGTININLAIISGIVILLIDLALYVRYSVPSAAVVISAFADIIMTLALVDFLGMKMSSAGIVAFLMLIGYSVDSDIMLTTRLLKRQGETNKNLAGAFKTGITMTLTSIVAITTALIIVQSFSEILKQIFTILLIGLIFDIPNTWITNASILKWYTDSRGKD